MTDTRLTKTDVIQNITNVSIQESLDNISNDVASANASQANNLEEANAAINDNTVPAGNNKRSNSVPQQSSEETSHTPRDYLTDKTDDDKPMSNAEEQIYLAKPRRIKITKLLDTPGFKSSSSIQNFVNSAEKDKAIQRQAEAAKAVDKNDKPFDIYESIDKALANISRDIETTSPKPRNIVGELSNLKSLPTHRQRPTARKLLLKDETGYSKPTASAPKPISRPKTNSTKPALPKRI